MTLSQVESERRLENRSEWVEHAILEEIAQAGTLSFKDLSKAIPVRLRPLRLAQKRLLKSGAIVVTGTTAIPTSKGTKSYPVYAVAGSTAHLQAHILAALASSSEVPAKPRRKGGKKGFVPGSSNDCLSREIPEALTKFGPLTRNDLRHHLGVPRTWLDRPLVRLLECGAILESPPTIYGTVGFASAVVTYHLPHQNPTPFRILYPDPFDEPREDSAQRPVQPVSVLPAIASIDADCPACEQISVGRGSCGSCAKSAGPSARPRSRH